MKPSVQAKIAVVMAGVTIALGTAGYYLLGHPDWTLFDALYQVIITVSTVGYQEVHPLGPAQRVLTMFVIVLGVGTLFYALNSLVELAVEDQLERGRNRMERMVSAMRGHFLVCGFGRMGMLVCRELHEAGLSFVVVERDEEALAVLEESNYVFVRGDATDETILEKAAIQNASGVVSLVSSDADNVFICLTARQLNPKLRILSRAYDERSEKKLIHAGANKVFSPYKMSGNRIAQAILRPSVVDFLEIATAGGKEELDLLMEELYIRGDSPLVGVTLMESNIRKEFGLIIIAIQRDGHMLFNPDPRTPIQEGDTLISLGEIENLKRLRKFVGPS